MTLIFELYSYFEKVKLMVNPFAYEEYRKDKIRQKIEETRAQRVQLKVGIVFSSLTSLSEKYKFILRVIAGKRAICFFIFPFLVYIFS